MTGSGFVVDGLGEAVGGMTGWLWLIVFLT